MGRIKELCVDKDGVSGYIHDVSDEKWYKEPVLTLYDQLEYDAFGLACDYAKLIGVHLDKDEIGDFYLAKEVSGAIMTVLEKEFQIPFPTTV